MHPHPYAPGEMMTECAGVRFAKPKPVAKGPSTIKNATMGEGDWPLFNRVNTALRSSNLSPVRMYVFDKANVYTMLPNPAGEPATDTYTTIAREIASCGA
jgi:hypothetical protein